MRRDAAVWLLLATGGALGVIALMRPDLLAGGRGANLLYLALLLAYVGSSVWAHGRANVGEMLRNAVLWAAIFVAVVAGWRLWRAWF